jgi:hypothetical protein
MVQKIHIHLFIYLSNKKTSTYFLSIKPRQIEIQKYQSYNIYYDNIFDI